MRPPGGERTSKASEAKASAMIDEKKLRAWIRKKLRENSTRPAEPAGRLGYELAICELQSWLAGETADPKKKRGTV